jgi:hypothetical protein
MKAAVLKYCQGGVHEMNRPEEIEVGKTDFSELD